MCPILLTGGTGLVGNPLARMLLDRGRAVRALVRDPARARPLLPPACEIVQGDVTDRASIARAMDGCAVVYHASGLPEQWMKDPALFQRVNVDGTRHMIDVALEQGVQKFVYTSTIDIFQAAAGEEYDESTIDPQPKGTYYERSKQDADRLVTHALDLGLPAVFLHPSGLYGPGPATSPGVNGLIIDLIKAQIPMLLPGGAPVVYTEDVAAGHILAEEQAPVGGRYILSERYFELVDLARAVLDEAGLKKVPPVLPVGIARVIANVGEFVSGLTGKPPLLPKGQLYFLQWRARPNGRKARETLGWNPVPFAEGLPRAIAFLRDAGRL